MDIDGARNNGNPAIQVFRQGVSASLITAHDLHIDRGGDAKIQNLIGDVGGLEKEDLRETAYAVLRAVLRCTSGTPGRSPSFMERRISPSPVPAVAESPKAILNPLGRPMLSMILANVPGGKRREWRLPPARRRVSVSSILVPPGARTCRRNCPVSMVGKKSEPTSPLFTRFPLQRLAAPRNMPLRGSSKRPEIHLPRHGIGPPQ